LRFLFKFLCYELRTIVRNNPIWNPISGKQFCLGNGIKHTLIAPYHPSSNGEAERFVQTLKTTIWKAKGAPQKTLCKFLLHYHSTPHASTGKTPAEIMFGRNIKTRQDLLHPRALVTLSPQIQKTMSEESPEKRCNELEVGDAVWIRNYCNSPRWIPRLVTMKYGPQNYQVSVNGKHHK